MLTGSLAYQDCCMCKPLHLAVAAISFCLFVFCKQLRPNLHYNFHVWYHCHHPAAASLLAATHAKLLLILSQWGLTKVLAVSSVSMTLLSLAVFAVVARPGAALKWVIFQVAAEDYDVGQGLCQQSSRPNMQSFVAGTHTRSHRISVGASSD